MGTKDPAFRNHFGPIDGQGINVEGKKSKKSQVILSQFFLHDVKTKFFLISVPRSSLVNFDTSLTS